MGAPIRPTEAITFQQAQAHTASRIKWYNYYGYITNLKELADIFGIPHITFKKRLAAGWPIDAALTAPVDQHWSFHTINYYVEHELSLSEIIEKLDNHFIPKLTKVGKGKKGVTVINGGFF